MKTSFMATFLLKELDSTSSYSNLVSGMQRYPFIFSDDRKWKVRRHLAFWGCWWLFSCLLYSYSAYLFKVDYFVRLRVSSVEAFFFLAPHMFLSYSLMYWLIPRFVLKGKYVISFFGIGALFLAAASISTLVATSILPSIRPYIVGPEYRVPPHVNELNVFNGLLSGLRGAITIGGLAAAIKLMKYWYMKEQKNLQLQRQNAQAQLQLLKAQVHPHFLFNTLNNIYSYTHSSSPVASKLVMGLSDMLRYILYECNQSLVPLDKELKMVSDYIALEKVRYNDELDLVTDLPKNTKDLHIAPLILLPFIENCFKHGTSQMLEQPWISLRITINDSRLEMKLINGKSSHPAKGNKGIGISNVKQRLELLYPGRHELKISEEEDVFIVDLALELEKRTRSKEHHSYETAEA